MTQRPNILLIFADQLAWRALPAHGDTYAQTPHIDRIAHRAVRFQEMYTPCPLCQPARAAYWTSRYPHETGVLSNGRKHYVPNVPEHLPTVGELFSNAGYTTVHFGKRHDAGSLRGFRLEEDGQLPVDEHPAWPLNGDTFRDRYTTEKTVDWLRGHDGDAPYLAVADLNNPHNICGWVGANAGPHQDVPVTGSLPQLPDNFEDRDLERRPRPVQYICCSHNRLSQAAAWTPENYRHYLRAYYYYLALVDAEIGRILDALEQRDDAANTLIVFTADHGDGMAAHRMVTKQVSFIEETVHIPFMVAGPPELVSGDRDVAPPASLLDLMPTLCDVAGVSALAASGEPAVMRGRSLRPWLEGAPGEEEGAYVASEWHTEWGYTVSPGRMLRTQRYKYTRYLEGHGEELYDLTNDRGETRTLIDDPEHAHALAAHRIRLEAHLRATDDPFFNLAWVADERWRSHPVGYAHHQGPAAPMIE